MGDRIAGFLNKKPWHPSSFRNQEKTWLAEQRARAPFSAPSDLLLDRTTGTGTRRLGFVGPVHQRWHWHRACAELFAISHPRLATWLTA